MESSSSAPGYCRFRTGSHTSAPLITVRFAYLPRSPDLFSTSQMSSSPHHRSFSPVSPVGGSQELRMLLLFWKYAICGRNRSQRWGLEQRTRSCIKLSEKSRDFFIVRQTTSWSSPPPSASNWLRGGGCRSKKYHSCQTALRPNSSAPTRAIPT